MNEITRKNCYKCDLETIINNDSQYFWINLKDFEVETESKWLNIFNKHGNSSTLKYRRELTPNIKFQADRIFVRNDLFEQVIKSCKATNIEFTMLKEKLGICPYEENYYEEKLKIQDDIEESDEELIEKLTVELNEESDEDSDEELTEVKIPKNNKNKADLYDTNKFKIILTTIDRNNFNHKNKIGKLKFSDINSLINNIKNNTISEADAKKINVLNEIKKAETKNKRLINGQENLLNLFNDLLEAIFNNNRRVNKNDNVSVNENDNVSVNENDNISVNENDNVSVNENDNVSVNENDNDDNDNESDNDYERYQDHKIKQLNNYFKGIDETKSFEEQIEMLKIRDYIDEYWHEGHYHDNKELNLQIFKTKYAYLSNNLDGQLFEEIFGHTFVALADKLINTTNKEENQIIIDDIEKNRDKLYKQDDFNNFITQPGYKRIDLIDAAKIIIIR